MTRRRLWWYSCAFMIVALTIGHGAIVSAQARRQKEQRTIRGVGKIDASLADARNEFILHAPANRVAAIAARRGLTVIRRLDPSRGIFLVSGPSRLGSRFDRIRDEDSREFKRLLDDVQDDADVSQFEVNSLVVTPEVAAGLNLPGSLAAIEVALADRSLVDYFGGQVWNGYINQSAVAAIRLSAIHAAGLTGAGTVAIIDTGVDPHHPLLAGALVTGYDFLRDIEGDGSEWIDLNGSPVAILDGSPVSILDRVSVVSLSGSTVAILDDGASRRIDPTQVPPAFGHGTMVAGVVHLVAPTAKIMPLRAFAPDGTSNVADIVRAIYYAVDHGARVINMSFSATAASPAIARAIDMATSRGVICVASAGNSGEEVLVYPGALRNVLGVGATTSTSPPGRSAFSNYGDALVSLGAPGEGVITTYPGGNYAGVWGTSFSTPMVSGAAALMVQLDPSVNQARVDSLLGNTEAMGAGMGKGRLNLAAVLRTLPDVAPPVVTLMSPAVGAVSGSVVVAASASDNIAVAGVQFMLDGAPLGAEDTAAPYELAWDTAPMANGAYMLTAVARDAAGNAATSAAVSVTVTNDATAPTVKITSPAAASSVSATTTVIATAADDLGVAGVQFLLDGAPLGAEATTAPYELAWDTATVANGAHTLTAVARDAAGQATTSLAVSVTVANDTTAPTVTVTSPAAASSVSASVTVIATAADDVGVAGVQFLLDGVPLGEEDTAAPYEVAWNTAPIANGAHTLTAVARDAAGHQTTAADVSVTVTNDTAAPTVKITGPAAASSVSATVTVMATAADDLGVAGVQFLLNGLPLGDEDTTAPYEVAWDTATAGNGAHTLTAIARDAAGQATTSVAVSVTVANDTTAPTVTVTSPGAASSVGATVTLSATAADDIGVSGVQFLLDGTPLGAEDTTAPYELAWDTAPIANGAHTLTAVARDAAGHATTSAAVSVTVMNDTASPTVAVTSPGAASSVSATVTVSATAADDIGVTGVQFLL
ncbi:MAG TPA: Ig-like domain-containing protein, partial [Vicinamibacterales bacterium]|nr:Ig-like domain-containing protein [Vicinamibacterales bacterium]